MPAPLGWKPILHEVKCVDCPTIILRPQFRSKHRCPPCKAKHHLKMQYARRKTWSTAARRYRIIMHTLGWEDSEFAEALDEMKRSPMMFRYHPESRDAQFDENTEKRKKRQEKSRRKYAEESGGSRTGVEGTRTVRERVLLSESSRPAEGQKDLRQVPEGRGHDGSGKDLRDLQEDGG